MKTIFNVKKPVVGIVHLPPLLSSPLYRGNFTYYNWENYIR